MFWKRLFRSSKSVGHRGEMAVWEYLQQQGWHILDTNYDRRVGEIDIIGQDQAGVIHFVEVKTVTDTNPGRQLEPVERVGPQKRAKLKKVISIYIDENRLLERDLDWQFDIVEVTLEPLKIEVLENVIL